MKKENTLQEISMKLDDNVGSLGLRVGILEDIAENLKHLQDDMDQAAHRGTEKFSFREHHREVRILAELMYYTMEELMKNQKVTESISEELLDMARGADLTADASA